MKNTVNTTAKSFTWVQGTHGNQGAYYYTTPKGNNILMMNRLDIEKIARHEKLPVSLVDEMVENSVFERQGRDGKHWFAKI